MLLSVLGCTRVAPIDDQTRLPPASEKCANPLPVPRDFQANNSRHEVLVAILNSGVDYNHPKLIDNIHFELDAAGHPVSAGWDFVGQDPWPSPYIGRTTATFEGEIEFFNELAQIDPTLENCLEACRNVIQEYITLAKHGTGVAGLIAQDNLEIGILPCRIVPPGKKKNEQDGYEIDILRNMLQSIDFALGQNADIVVATSFFVFERKDDPYYSRALYFKKKIQERIRKNSDVLFIVSAGNCEGLQFSGDEPDRVILPAGIAAENLLVVGSLSSNGTISSFSNLPGKDLQTVYCPGEDIKTISPTKMINVSSEQMLALIYDLDSMLGDDYYNNIVRSLHTLLEDERNTFASGTSFSTAIAARFCCESWLEYPGLTPRQVISNLISFSSRSGCRIEVH